MRYFVIGTDNQKYGPVDLAQLQQWVNEGRVLRNTMVVEESSGQQYAASAVAGLNFPVTTAPPNAGPQGASQYYHRPGYGAPNNFDSRPAPQTGQTIGLAIFSLICCCWPLGIVSLVYAIQANSNASSGNISEAYRLNDQARNWAYWSIALGLIVGVIYFFAGMSNGFR